MAHPSNIFLSYYLAGFRWITGDIAGLLKAGIGKTITTVATMKLRPAGLVNLIQLLEVS